MIVPLFAVVVSLRLLRIHLQANQIIVSELGLKINHQPDNVFIPWQSVRQVREKPFYDGGLIILTDQNKRAFIPAGVKNYKAIKLLVAKKVVQRSDEAGHPA